MKRLKLSIFVLIGLISSNLYANESIDAESRLVIKKIDRALSNIDNIELSQLEKKVDFENEFSITLIKKTIEVKK